MCSLIHNLPGETCSKPAGFLTDFFLARCLASGSVLSSSSSPSLWVPSLYLPDSYPPVELACFLCASADRLPVPFFLGLPSVITSPGPFPNSCCNLPLTSDMVSYPFCSASFCCSGVDSKIGWEMIVPRFLESPFVFFPIELDFSSTTVVFVADLS